jgi:hypothetical protein
MKIENAEELWLLDPENKAIVKELKKAITQKADICIDLDNLEKAIDTQRRS